MEYKTGRIYKIVCGQSDKCYVGSTFNELKYRFKSHKGHYNEWKNGKVNLTTSFYLFEKYGIENCKIILVKEYEVTDRKHMQAYEQLWINKLNTVNKLNTIYMKRMIDKEWREKNKQKVAQSKTKYYEANKEVCIKRASLYNKNNKEKRHEKIDCFICKKLVSKTHFARHKQTAKHLKNAQKN